MRKLLKKKVNVFGKGIPVFAIVILGIALVGAALVGYIGNVVTGEVVVDSPLQQFISYHVDEWETDDKVTFGIHGGESVTFYVKDVNNANISITGIAENRVTNPDGVTCNDFVSVIVTTETTIDGDVQEGSNIPHDLILYNQIVDPIGSFCKQEGGNDIVFMYGPKAPTSNENTWAVGQEDISGIAVTFKTNALGTYTFTSNILPEEE